MAEMVWHPETVLQRDRGRGNRTAAAFAAALLATHSAVLDRAPPRRSWGAEHALLRMQPQANGAGELYLLVPARR
jgi:hypothetical protein